MTTRHRHKASTHTTGYWVCDRCGAKRPFNSYKPWAYPNPWVKDNKTTQWCEPTKKVKP